MTKQVREALARVENEATLAEPETMTTSYIQFINDLWTLIHYIESREQKKKRRKMTNETN
jgi:hypothetical protein